MPRPAARAQAGVMAEEGKIPQFGAEARRELFQQRVLVLDGAARRRQRHPAGDAAARARGGGRGIRYLALDPLARRLGAVDARDPRRDAAHPQRRRDPGARPRVQRRAVPAARRHEGQAQGAAARADPHASGLVRHRRIDGRGRGAGRRPATHARHRARAIVSEDTGQPVERIFEDSLHDRWYTAAEALDYGFIDGIVDDFAQVVPRRRRPAGLGLGPAGVAA